MPFQIICARNKGFWSKIVTAICGFALVIVAMAVVFPISSVDNTQSATQIDSFATITTETQAEQENA